MRLFLLLLLSLSFLLSGETTVYEGIEKDSDSIIIKDLANDKTILAKDEKKLLRPASLTKIMTCILAIESKKMNDIVTITSNMIDIEPTKIGLQIGQKIYLKDLVHVALIKSANDAANAIAYYLGAGNLEKFIEIMNKKANELHMNDTYFTNPCGFDIGGHRSTAHDLTKLTEYAITSSTFNSIVKLNKYSFKTINTKKSYTVVTSNKLQRDHSYIVGIKTGFTNAAGPCLIARAKKNKKDILLVMLNASNRWLNAEKAFNEATKTKPDIQYKATFSKKKNIVNLFNS